MTSVAKETLSSQERSVPFALSLIAGVLILLAGLARATFMTVLSPRTTVVGLNRILSIILRPTGLGLGATISTISAVFLMVSGILILVGAVMLNLPSQQFSTWGMIILVFSTVGLFAGGGFLASLGSLLGIVGGVLSITLRSTSRSV